MNTELIFACGVLGVSLLVIIAAVLLSGIGTVRSQRRALRLSEVLEKPADAQRTAGEMNDIVRAVCKARADRASALATAKRVCPGGYAVVPIEPTPAMLKAAAKAMSPGCRPTPEWVPVREKHRIRYRAMVTEFTKQPEERNR